MSDIVFKSLNFALEAVKGKHLVQPFDLIEFLSLLSKYSLAKNEAVKLMQKFSQQLQKQFDSSSLSQKRKYLIAISFCCQSEYICDATIKDLLTSSAKHVITFMEQSKTLVDKKIAYLALTSLISHCSPDIGYLSVNSLIKDISSKNPKLVQFALQAVTQLHAVDCVAMLCPIVEKRLSHNVPDVRIDAIYALHAMLQVAPEFVQNTTHHVKISLSDRCPQVMAAALPYVSRIVMKDPSKFPELPSKLIFILKQVAEGHLPIEMSYHGIPAPWLQINILKLLIFTQVDEEQLNMLSEILQKIFNRCETSKYRMSFALKSQCIDLIVALFPKQHPVFQHAVLCLGSYLQSKHANLLLSGLQLLTKVSSVDPVLCFPYQSIIMTCVEHSDLSIKKQTLILLETLINKDNYKMITLHMIDQLKTNKWEENFVQSLSEKISNLVEKMADDSDWLLETYHAILLAAGDHVTSTVCGKILLCLKTAHSDVIRKEVKRCLSYRKLSSHHFRCIARVSSDYFHIGEDETSFVIKSITDQLPISSSEDDVIAFILAITKICSSAGDFPDDVITQVAAAIGAFLSSSPVVHQRFAELKVLLENQEMMKVIKNMNEIKFDPSFSFLDDLVAKSKEKYKDVQFVKTEKSSFVSKESSRSLSISVEHKPKQVKTKTEFIASIVPEKQQKKMEESFLSRKVPSTHKSVKVWGKTGYMGTKESHKPATDSQSYSSELSAALFGSQRGNHQSTLTSNVPSLTSDPASTLQSSKTFDLEQPNFDPNHVKTDFAHMSFRDDPVISRASGVTSDPHIAMTSDARGQPSGPSLNQALENLSVLTKSSEKDKDILDKLLMKTQSDGDVINSLQFSVNADDDI